MVAGEAASSASEAVAAAEKIGYPVVMKIISPDILHKSDVGGIKLNLDSASAVEEAYQQMMRGIAAKMPAARLDGVLIGLRRKDRR